MPTSARTSSLDVLTLTKLALSTPPRGEAAHDTILEAEQELQALRRGRGRGRAFTDSDVSYGFDGCFERCSSKVSTADDPADECSLVSEESLDGTGSDAVSSLDVETCDHGFVMREMSERRSKDLALMVKSSPWRRTVVDISSVSVTDHANSVPFPHSRPQPEPQSEPQPSPSAVPQATTPEAAAPAPILEMQQAPCVTWVLMPVNGFHMNMSFCPWGALSGGVPTMVWNEVVPSLVGAQASLVMKEVIVSDGVACCVSKSKGKIEVLCGVTLAFNPCSEAGQCPVCVTGHPPCVQRALHYVEAFAAAAGEGLESPTTVMVKNLPLGVLRDGLVGLLKGKGFSEKYDFLYIPMDFKRNLNNGYAFVNLRSFDDAVSLMEVLHGFGDWNSTSVKVTEVMWATELQGRHAYVNRFQNSTVMHPDVPEHFKPLLVGDDGQYTPFPAPTRRIRQPYAKNIGASRAERRASATTRRCDPDVERSLL